MKRNSIASEYVKVTAGGEIPSVVSFSGGLWVVAWDNVLHKRLRDICAYLWEDSRDCRRLVADSLIDSSRINWDEPPSLRWQSVILECEKQGTLYKLCPVLLAEYPENTHLREAVAPWITTFSGASPSGDKKTKEEPVKEPEKKKVPIEIPIEYADLAEEIPITLESIRADLTYISKSVSELKRWRQELSIISSKSMIGEQEAVLPVKVSLPDKKASE